MLFIDDMTQNIVINFLEDLKHEGFQIESKSDDSDKDSNRCHKVYHYKWEVGYKISIK